jgi:hypothetical protein
LISHILRWKYLIKHVIKGKIKGAKRRERKRQQLLCDLKEKRR